MSSTAPERLRLGLPSTLDQTIQPSYLILPPGYTASDAPRPLVVSLHTWSFDVEQRDTKLEQEAAERGWLYLFPHFRGENQQPEACGSELVQQDILDAVDHVLAEYRADPHRVYVTGKSGGGHLTLLMAGRHPARWAAASAWVPISDLADWYRTHEGQPYGDSLVKSCGGTPAEAPDEYAARSPLTWLHQAVDLPLDIGAGIHDGHTGSVPIRQTLWAFNRVAAAQGLPTVSDAEMALLSTPDGRLTEPQPSDLAPDPTFGRGLYLRRTAGKCRVTIFEGGHEGLAHAAAEFLSGHCRD